MALISVVGWLAGLRAYHLYPFCICNYFSQQKISSNSDCTFLAIHLPIATVPSISPCDDEINPQYRPTGIVSGRAGCLSLHRSKGRKQCRLKATATQQNMQRCQNQQEKLVSPLANPQPETRRGDGATPFRPPLSQPLPPQPVRPRKTTRPTPIVIPPFS